MEPRQLPHAVGPALRRGLRPHARARPLRHASTTLADRLSRSPTGSRATRADKTLRPALRRDPVLDELPDPHVRVADHPRPRVPALPRSSTSTSSSRRPAVYIGVAYNYLPLMVLPLYAALERIDWSLVEAAQDLGDTPLRSFRRVTLPLALAGRRGGLAARLHPADGRVPDPRDPRRQQDVVHRLADRAAVHRGERLAVRLGDRVRRDRRR